MGETLSCDIERGYAVYFKVLRELPFSIYSGGLRCGMTEGEMTFELMMADLPRCPVHAPSGEQLGRSETRATEYILLSQMVSWERR
jgi:hypothetical protein